MKRHGSLNRIYRLVWSRVANSWVPVAETARRRGKGACRRDRRKLVAAAASLSAAGFISPFALAGPTGGQVVSGTGTIAQSGTTTTVKQSSQDLSLNWATFNIAPQETVNFVQPSASAIAVNRIFDINGSQILGHLDANGQVYLINPNGVLFGASAQVNVGGLVASTLDVTDASLGGSARSFSGGGTGGVVNQGTINAANGGYVALLGNHVSNQGVITAQLGAVALGAGSAVTLTFKGDSLVHVQVDQSVLNSLAENGGLIRADGGTVVMTAGAANSLLASVVNNAGVIEARTVQNLGNDQSGTITLLGGMTAGTADVGGTLDASAPNGGNGGAIETSAANVKIDSGAGVTTAAPHGLYGSWLIDPNDFTVEASGGNETGAVLSSALAAGNVTILSSSGSAGSGNVNIDDTVSWSTNTTLTLTASNNVNVNSSVTAIGASAGVAINPNTANGGQSATGSGVFNMGPGGVINLPNVSSGSTTALVIGGTSFSVINNAAALQAINSNSTTLGRNYALGSNISASSGFTPIGMSSLYGTPFSGTFDGLGHVINGLGISVSNPVQYEQGWGLFGGSTGTIRNVGLTGGSITAIAAGYVGGLVGANYGTITNSFSTNSVTASGGSTRVGGLVGFNYGATVTKSYSSATVSGGSDGTYVGGLIGWSEASTVSNSFATGSVSGGNYVGGLVGGHSGNTGKSSLLTNSYATGNVSGNSYVGGLAGFNFDYGGTATISNTYAAGHVTGGLYVGGLAGQNNNGQGGTATVSASFWNSSVNSSLSGIGSNGGTTASTGGTTGLTSANLEQSASTISSGGWSTSIWTIYNGATYPLLQSFMTPLTVTANNQTTTYSGVSFSGGNGATYTSYGATVSPTLSGSLTYTGSSQGAKHAGSYTITPGGLYSSQLGYLITDANGTLTINSKTLTPTLTNSGVTKSYDGTTNAPSGFTPTYSFSGLVSGDTGATLTDTGAAYDSAHVASATALTVSGLSISSITGSNGSLAGDYALSGTSASVAATIIPANVTIGLSNITNVAKTYDGTTAVPGGFTPTYTIAGLVAGDSATVSTSSTPTYNSAHVASATVITQGGLSLSSINGNGVDNSVLSDYTLSSTTASTGNGIASVSPLVVTATAPTIGGTTTKVYDGTTIATGATLNGGSVSGALSGDALSLDTAGVSLNYNSSHVASASSIGASGSLSVDIVSSTNGSQSTDYSLSLPSIASAAGTITSATLTVSLSNITNVTKTYDGTTASPSGFSPTYSVSGLVSGDSATVSSSSTPTYNSAHVASATVITQGGLSLNSITGNGSDNSVLSDYALSNTTASTGNGIASITPLTLAATAPTIGGLTTKVYDGTTAATGATVSGGGVSGALSGDTLTLDTSGINLDYNSSHVASASSIGASGSLSVDIVSSSNGSQSTDYSVSLPSIASVAGTITPASLTASLSNTNVTKAYDGTTAAPAGFTPTYSITGLVSGDSATVSGSTPVYNSAHVASATAITQTGLSLASISGNGSDNSALSDYTLSNTSVSTGTGVASITPLTLAATAPTIGGITTKVYDGTTAATGATVSGGGVSGAVSGDTLTLNTSGINLDYNSSHVASASSIGAGGSLSVDIVSSSNGSQSTDYSVSLPSIASVAGTITPASLTASLSNTTNGIKAYDGTTAAPSGFVPTYSITGLVAGDSATVSGSAPVYNSAHVASATAITQGGLSLSSVTGNGTDNSVLSDYTLSNTTVSTANGVAGITPALVTVTMPTISGMATKVYDGTTAATGAILSGGSLGGAVSGDTLTLDTSGISLNYNSSQVAAANSIGASGSLSMNISSSVNGSQSTDYSVSLSSIASVAGTITPAILTASLSNTASVTKTYDGTTAAPAGFTPTYSITGLLAGDSATVSGSVPVYNSAHVASATTITQGGLSLSSITGNGTDNSVLSDYTLANTGASTGNGIASITPAAVTSTAPVIGGITTKVYDGTTAATGAILSGGSVSGAAGGDTLTLDTSGVSLNYNTAQTTATTISASGSVSLDISSSTVGSLPSDYSLTQPVIASVPGTITAAPAPTSTPVPADLPSPLLLVLQPGAQSEAGHATSESTLGGDGADTRMGLNLHVIEGGVRLPDDLVIGQ